MYELIYASSPTRPLQPKQLSELLAGSRTRNLHLDVSGVLLHQGGSFLQVLEGEEPVVAALYEKICKDPRHTRMFVVSRGPVAARHFGPWTMGFVDVVPAVVQKLGGWNPFMQKATVTAEKNVAGLRALLSGKR
jgi:hypothetical protein